MKLDLHVHVHVHVCLHLIFLIRPKNGALFFLELVIDIEGVHYTTDLESFKSTLVSVFDRGIQSTHTVPQLEKVSSVAQTHVHVHDVMPNYCMYHMYMYLYSWNKIVHVHILHVMVLLTLIIYICTCICTNVVLVNYNYN